VGVSDAVEEELIDTEGEGLGEAAHPGQYEGAGIEQLNSMM